MDISTVGRWAGTVKDDIPTTANLHGHAHSAPPIATTVTQHQACVEGLARVNRLVKRKDITVMLEIST